MKRRLKINYLFLSFAVCLISGIYYGSISFAGGYSSFDPFRDEFLKLKFNPPVKPKNNKDKIPKIIHQFWIGDKPLPDPYVHIMQTCKNLKGFTHMLWTNEDIEKLLAEFSEYRETFYKIPKHDTAVQKDLLSYLVLKKYGGVALDASIICRDGFGDMHEHYSHYFNYQCPNKECHNLNHSGLMVANIIGSTKNSPIIDEVLERFKIFTTNFVSYNKKYTQSSFTPKDAWHGWVGQVVMNEAIYKYCFTNKEPCDGVHILNEELSSHICPAFIDSDSLPLAYIIKGLYTRVTTIEALLGFKCNNYKDK